MKNRPAEQTGRLGNEILCSEDLENPGSGREGRNRSLVLRRDCRDLILV
jgi:hypothetical protein